MIWKWKMIAIAWVASCVLPEVGTCAWQTFRVSDGLGYDVVNGMLEDRNSILWFGTGSDVSGTNEGGVTRYDGVSWRTFTSADGLASNQVRMVLEDRRGAIWVQYIFRNGVSRYDGASWRTFTTADGLGGDGVTGMLEDRSGALWFSTLAKGGVGTGVTRYDGTSWQTFTTTDGLGGNVVSGMLEDRSGALWFSTLAEGFVGTGVTRYDGRSWQTFTTANGLPYDAVSQMIDDPTGGIWLVTTGDIHTFGISRYDSTGWKTLPPLELPADGMWLFADRSGILWAGTVWGLGEGAVSRFDGTKWSTVDSVFDGAVDGVLEDRSGALWFGSYHGGLVRYSGPGWQRFTTVDGLPNNRVRPMLEDSNGGLWFVTAAGGVSRYTGDSWRTFTTADAPANGQDVYTLFEDRRGALWLPSSDPDAGGIARFDGVGWRTFTTADGLGGTSVSTLLEDRSGALWLATYDNATHKATGVTRYDGVRWDTFLPDKEVYRMYEARGGVLWFAHHDPLGYGVTRYDGAAWHTFTTVDGLANSPVGGIIEDHTGVMWFGTHDGGVSRYDGVGWRTFTTADGLGLNRVGAMVEDHNGGMWFAHPGGFQDQSGGGVSHYDGVRWRVLTSADGLASNNVIAMFEDRSGALWFATYRVNDLCSGVTRYDGARWQTFPVKAPWLEDHLGALWFASCDGGVARYDGTNWQAFKIADGLASNYVSAMIEDRHGSVWFGGPGVLSRYDGVRWRRSAYLEGNLPDAGVNAIIEHSSGALWIASRGVTRLEPDRVSPQAVLTSRPPPVSANTIPAISFTAGFRDAGGIQFSWSLDGPLWSDWSFESAWPSTALPDGQHTFSVRARDEMDNVDPTPATVVFEIDAKPPLPVIVSPAAGQAVRDSLVIRGSASAPRFEKYRLELRRPGSASWDSLLQDTVPVANGVVARVALDPESFPDGVYDVRLAVSNTLGLTGTALVPFVVDNVAPFVDQTSPARITAGLGGHVYTTNREIHLYFPPGAFAVDAVVTISPMAQMELPDTLANGAVRVTGAFAVDWASAALTKPASLEFSYAGLAAQGSLALYATEGTGSEWRRVGGTVDGSSHHVAASIANPGKYALYVDAATPEDTGGLSLLALTPRVFSPNGSFADRRIGIGFTLGRAGSVTVKVFNRAGRLAREVVHGATMGPGANLVWWDGADRGGRVVEEGMYVVTVEALGERRQQTLAIVK
jgi:ligand-binding sensor domain-containing protein